MPLADKIIELRKKQGWSQIDLADRLDVSRQSVSKWEMAQAVPELDKIIKMSELFTVTTDYLLKDDIPKPEPESPALEALGSTPPPPPEELPQTVPEPEKEAPPAKKSRKKWPWAAAAVLVLVCGVLGVRGVVAGKRQALPQATQVPLVDPTPTPAPMPAEQAMTAGPTPAPVAVGEVAVPWTDAPATDDTVMEVPVTEMTAVSDPDADAPELGMMESVYEEGAVMGGSIDPAALAAIAAEYAPFGVTCDGDYGQWYLDGEPVRVFTDILTSNGESLIGGHFQGTIRNFTGEGEVDVRTVRDFNHCDTDGVGKLLYVESCPAHGDAVWTEHHADLHHTEDHHE